MLRKLFLELRCDRHGTVAFEMPFVMIFLFLVFLFPLADMAIMSSQFISAYQGLRDLGQYTQYHVPPDVTNVGSWVSSLPSTGYAITTKVYCGDTASACATGTTIPKYFSFSTSVTLNPLVLRPVLCTSGNADPCTYTIAYTERFE